jgi:two-component system, OmpR family, sensor histidine kinase KdpD
VTHQRPDPDVLLQRIRAEEARERRGQLKVFLGASPGVGKTFTMLETARAKRADGLDVVVGVVETHGRAETGRLLEGLEVIPRRTVEYRGVQLEEFDLDAALARHPALLLVDELAHTNAPGSRHAKRWQDVQELLAAGVNVYTTVNIQHFESLNDVVAQITGVTVRETVPDSVLERADEVELVDITPDVLQQRLREGKVYVPEQAGRAIERFFRKGNLIALRELALRRTAERVDAQMRGYMAEQGIRETWATGERMVVCIGPSPSAARLVRATRRMAARLHAEWFAVNVETPRDQRLTAAEREDILRAMELAEQLGGRPVTLSGQSAAEEILTYARDHNVTRIIMGKTRRPRWRELFQGSLLDALVRGSGGIEVLAITGAEDEDGARPAPAAPPRGSTPREYVMAAGIVVVPTLLGLIVRRVGVMVPPIDAAMLYLLAVVVAAARFRRGPAVVASLVGIASFDFFFVHPFYTFSVSDVRYVLTFGVMLVVALVLGNLTGRIRSQAEAAREREQRTSALYGLSRELAAARDRDAVLGAALRSLRDTFAIEAAVLLPGEAGAVAAVGSPPYPFDERERAVAQWSFDHGQAAGRGTTTLPGAGAFYVPLASSGRAFGVIGLPLADTAQFRDPAPRRLLESLAGQTAAALERLALAERSRESEVEVEAERLRTALLSSLSHDMRTPLASIEGAASTLLQETEPGPAARRDLAATIVQESHRMGRLVANLLDMIRVEAGTLQVHKEWQLLSDVVGVALLRTEDQLRGHPVETAFPPDLPLVPMDEILLEQVFVNLLENAAKHTPAGTPIEVGAESRPGEVIAYVADRGPGLPPGEEETIFRKFHRGGGSAGGIGLGLTICRGIVTAHGGRIWAENRSGGGAIFRIALPITGTPPQLLSEEPAPDRQESEAAGVWTGPPPSSS